MKETNKKLQTKASQNVPIKEMNLFVRAYSPHSRCEIC